jgi:hypothetical protein
MRNSPAWKFYLLNDALPKFTAAVTACADKDDTSEIKAPTKKFLSSVYNLVFPG